jgi:hypothetical protein
MQAPPAPRWSGEPLASAPTIRSLRRMSFQQEVAPGVAEDRATVVRTGRAKLPDGTVVNTITVRDFNPLDGSRGTKVYAQGVGLIEDDSLRLLSVTGL